MLQAASRLDWNELKTAGRRSRKPAVTAAPLVEPSDAVTRRADCRPSHINARAAPEIPARLREIPFRAFERRLRDIKTAAKRSPLGKLTPLPPKTLRAAIDTPPFR